MKRHGFVIVAVGLLLGIAYGVSEGQGKDATLQGKWTVVSITDGGVKQEVPKGSTATVTANKFTMEEGGKTLVEYPFKIDSAKSPKWIDLGAGKESIPGIYETKGNTLTICISAPGMKRSTSFESKAKSENDVLMVFQRDK